MHVLVYVSQEYNSDNGFYVKHLEVIQFFFNKEEGEKALAVMEAAHASHERYVELIPHSEFLAIAQGDE